MATTFSVRAHPGAKRRSLSLVSESPLVLRAELPGPPEGNRANRRLLFELEKALACDVRIIAGHKSRKKTLAAECDAASVVEKIKKWEK